MFHLSLIGRWKKSLHFCSYLNAQSQNISGCHHCKHSRLSQRRCTCVKILNPVWAENQTILRTSYMDFLPCLHLSTPTMKYPEENGNPQVEVTYPGTVSTSAITECSKQAKGKHTPETCSDISSSVKTQTVPMWTASKTKEKIQNWTHHSNLRSLLIREHPFITWTKVI